MVKVTQLELSIVHRIQVLPMDCFLVANKSQAQRSGLVLRVHDSLLGLGFECEQRIHLSYHLSS